MYHRMQQTSRLTIPIVCACLLALFLALPAHAAANHAATKPGSATSESVEHGNALFQQSCAICHGAGAMGGIGPNLLESPIVQEQKYYGNEVVLVIQDGRVDRGMPAFPTMTDANISDILAFLHARIEAAGSAGSTRAAALKRLLTGNAEAGKQYFYGQGKCSTCHSPTGDLAGIANKYQPEELQSRFLSPPDKNVTATVSLPSGNKVQGKLLHLDSFYVAIQEKDGAYRSWPIEKVTVQVEDPLNAHKELLRNYTNKDVHNVFAYLETLQ